MQGDFIMITFSPLWETMRKKNITKYTLTEHYHFSKALVKRLRNNQSVTLCTIERLCAILQCDISDIVIVTCDSDTASEIEKRKE